MELTNYQELQFKTRSFVKLVQYLRGEQKEYFTAKRHGDYHSSQRLMAACMALEKRVDDECEKMLDFIVTNGKPQLFQ